MEADAKLCKLQEVLAASTPCLVANAKLNGSDSFGRSRGNPGNAGNSSGSPENAGTSSVIVGNAGNSSARGNLRIAGNPSASGNLRNAGNSSARGNLRNAGNGWFALAREKSKILPS